MNDYNVDALLDQIAKLQKENDKLKEKLENFKYYSELAYHSLREIIWTT